MIIEKISASQSQYKWYISQYKWYNKKCRVGQRGIGLINLLPLSFFSNTFHCVKSVQTRSYFLFIFSCIQTEYRKIRTRNNSVFGHFLCSVYYSSSFRYAQLAVLFRLSQRIVAELFLKFFGTIIAWCFIIRQNSFGQPDDFLW